MHQQKLMDDASIWKEREKCTGIYQLEREIQRYLERYGTAPLDANGLVPELEEVVAKPGTELLDDGKEAFTKSDTHATKLDPDQTLANNTIHNF